jgi:hypothetical protein
MESAHGICSDVLGLHIGFHLFSTCSAGWVRLIMCQAIQAAEC